MVCFSRRLVTAALFLAVWPAIAAHAQSLASSSDRREAFAHYRSGQELLAAEQFEKAAEEFGASIKFDPLFTDAHYGRGQAFMGLQRYTSAIQAFNGCVEAARRLHELRHRDRVVTDKAIDEEIRELKDSVRRVASGQVRVGQPQIKQTQLEQRIQELERSRSSLSANFEPPATVLLSLGSAHFRNGDRAAAEQNWTEAVKINNRLGEGWNNLAVIHLGAGRKKEAEEAVRNAERAGFRVNPRLKDDIRAMKS
jgi:tetratricopeptide (TPR) repeat protein